MNESSVEEKLIVKNKKYELVPPDGGHGYCICLAVIINFSTLSSFISCFGLLFDDFMKEINMSSTAVTLLTGVNAVCIAISGFFTSAILKIMTKRKLALMAALSFDLGVLGTVFAKSISSFFICQGIMQGVGLGILYNLSCTIMNEYFLKKRLFAFSIVQTITAVTAMVAPLFVKWSLNAYGFRGSLLIITGISLQNLFAVAMMHPVEWHLKRVEIFVEAEMQIITKKIPTGKDDIPIVKLTDVEAVKSSPEKVYDFPADNNKSTGIKKILEAMVDIPLCKEIMLSCVCLGPAICSFADMMYVLILPQALYSNGWNQDNVALAIAVFGFGDLATRVLLIFSSKCLLYVGSQETYVLGLVVGFLARIGMLCSTNIVAILIYIFLMGASHCIICVLITVVISDTVSSDKFSSALGILFLINGGVNLVFGPAIGAVRDLTNSYSAAFYLLTSCYAIMSLFWSIELCYKKNKHKRIQRKISKKSCKSIKK